MQLSRIRGTTVEKALKQVRKLSSSLIYFNFLPIFFQLWNFINLFIVGL